MYSDSTYSDSLKADLQELSNVPEISVNAFLSSENVSVGDTLTYTVALSVDAPVVLPVIAQSSVNAKGISQESVKQVSSREISQGKTISKVEFVYTLSVNDTGNLSLPKLSFAIPQGDSLPLVIQSEPYSFYVESPLNPLPFLGGLFCAVAIVLVAFLKKKKQVKKRVLLQKHNELKDVIINDMLVLKARTSVADSREWLQNLEQVFDNFSKLRVGETSFVKAVRLKKISDGDFFVKLFDEARYGGTKRDVFELREIWKTAVALMNLEEDLKQVEDN